MKQFLFTLSLAFSLITSSVSASETGVSNAALKSFAALFASAKDVSWSESENYNVARFTLDKKVKYAYFTTSGELAVVAEPIAEKDLSDKERFNLYKAYEDFVITDLYEMENEEGTKVFAVVENDSKKIILRSNGSKWEVVKSRTK